MMAMRASTIVSIVGLSGCSPQPATPEPPALVPVPAPAPEPETLTTPDQGQPGELNAQSSLHGRVYATGSGACAVHRPWPEGTVLPTGVHLNLHAVDCPEAMLDPAHQSCAKGILRRLSEDACVCEPVLGNPPPPGEPHACPG